MTHSGTVFKRHVHALPHQPDDGDGRRQPPWAALMAKMRRKTLIVCAACHDYIHANPIANTA